MSDQDRGPDYMLTDAWFEPDTQYGLMIAMGPPISPEVTELNVPTMGGIVVFRRIANIKGRAIFQAIEWRRADDPGLSSPDRLSRLAGPFQRGPRDVA